MPERKLLWLPWLCALASLTALNSGPAVGA